MKNIKFLLGLLTIVVIMASCATTQEATNDPYANDPTAQRIGNRVYLEDPYRGTVILEQNPVTGRYYDVTNGYGFGFGPGYYGAYPYGGGYRGGFRGYRGGAVIHQSAPSSGEIQQNRGEARRRILGN